MKAILLVTKNSVRDVAAAQRLHWNIIEWTAKMFIHEWVCNKHTYINTLYGTIQVSHFRKIRKFRLGWKFQIPSGEPNNKLKICRSFPPTTCWRKCLLMFTWVNFQTLLLFFSQEPTINRSQYQRQSMFMKNWRMSHSRSSQLFAMQRPNLIYFSKVMTTKEKKI